MQWEIESGRRAGELQLDINRAVEELQNELQSKSSALEELQNEILSPKSTKTLAMPESPESPASDLAVRETVLLLRKSLRETGEELRVKSEDYELLQADFISQKAPMCSALR